MRRCRGVGGVPGRKLGSMVRINGLFHLLINGVYSGYNPLILTIYYLPTGHIQVGWRGISWDSSSESFHQITKSRWTVCESPCLGLFCRGFPWCFVCFLKGEGESKGCWKGSRFFDGKLKGRMGN